VWEGGGGLLGEAVRARLRRVATGVADGGQVVFERRGQKGLESFEIPAPAVDVPPMLLEMERVLQLLSKAEKALPDELKGFPLMPKGGALVADAFKNPEYVHFAVKGALAAFICYLIFSRTA